MLAPAAWLFTLSQFEQMLYDALMVERERAACQYFGGLTVGVLMFVDGKPAAIWLGI